MDVWLRAAFLVSLRVCVW